MPPVSIPQLVRRTLSIGASSALLLSAAGFAEVHGKTLEYRDGKTVLEGYLAYDPAQTGKRPGIVVVHDWMGLGDFMKKKADDLARLGYVVLAADIYGKGVRPKDAKEAAALATQYKAGDRATLRRRARAALDTLAMQPQVDASKLIAMGFCFGGTTALELARSGAPLVGIVTFHANLDTPNPADAKNIKGKILAMTGADDPYVPADQVLAFEKEMRDAGVDWQLITYSGAVHSFTIPSAGNDNSKGAAYNAKADRRSWQAMKDFFAELFG